MPTIINQLEQGIERETPDTKDEFVRHPEKAHRKDNPIARKPSWIRVKAPNSEEYFKTKALMKDLSLTTVCEEAACPNIGECWSQNHATFMIMGEICTRACAFCNVRTGLPDPLESEEPKNVGEATAKLGLSHVVITSVDRDDLADGGAEHFRQTIEQIRLQAPQTSVEILTPDFLRKDGALAHLLQTPPDVFNHNLETVPSLYRTIRPGSRYFQSLRLLQEAKELVPHIFTKSGLMVGLGETVDELYQVMDDLRTADVDFLTIGQYLQPTVKHASVQEFITPQTFAKLEEHAYAKGFLMVSASPLTRSSYHAGDDFEKLRAARTKQLKST